MGARSKTGGKPTHTCPHQNTRACTHTHKNTHAHTHTHTNTHTHLHRLRADAAQLRAVLQGVYAHGVVVAADNKEPGVCVCVRVCVCGCVRVCVCVCVRVRVLCLCTRCKHAGAGLPPLNARTCSAAGRAARAPGPCRPRRRRRRAWPSPAAGPWGPSQSRSPRRRSG